MKALRAVVVLAVFGVVGLLLAGCSETNSADGAPTADELFSQGVTYLEDTMTDADLDQPPWEWDVDMAEANAYFEDALGLDPDHCGALLLAAITRLALVFQDPDLADIVEELFPDEGRGPDGPGTFLFRALRKPDVYAAARRLMASGGDYLSFSDLQDFIESDVLPALDYADGNLTQFEDQDCVVLLHVEIEEQRAAVEIEIDVSDVFLMHAPLDMLQSMLYMVVSYNVDVAGGQTLQELIDDDPDFLSLRPGDHMASAYTELFEMEDHLSDGAWSLANETDPQDTDLFTNSDDEGWIPLGEGFADTLSSIAAEMHDALTNGLSFNPADDTGDPGAPDIDILVDLEELFTDPLDPVTDYFPAHTWFDSMTMDVTEPIDFPDPTFSNITPGMTDGDWGDVFDWLNED
ncbi:MAG: hypothetical protein ABIK85_02870 [Candidatus Eisenbacteria bacterium]